MTKSIEFHDLRRGLLPNDCLVLPEGFQAVARPDFASPTFAAAPKDLVQTVKEIATDRPDTTLVHETIGSHRLELVRRSRIFRFPDHITIQAFPAAGGGSSLAIYSAAKFGITDLGVNRRQTQALLDALKERLSAR